MKKLFLYISLIFLCAVVNAQTNMPKGMKVGKIVSGTNIITIDSISQYSTDGIRFYKGAVQLFPYMNHDYILDWVTATAAFVTGTPWTAMGYYIGDGSAFDPAGAAAAITLSGLGGVPTSRTVNGHALTGNVSVTAADVGLGNVTNESKTTMFSSPTFTTIAKLGTDTISTKAYARSVGGLDITAADAKYLQLADTIPFSSISYTKAEIDAKTAINFTLTIDPSAFAAPTGGKTYYYGSGQGLGLSENIAGTRPIKLPYNCTLVGWSLTVRGSSAAATTENGTLYVRVNNATDLALSNAIHWNGAYGVVTYSGVGLSTNYTANDLIEMKFVAPATWSVSPNSITMSTVLYFRLQ